MSATGYHTTSGSLEVAIKGQKNTVQDTKFKECPYDCFWVYLFKTHSNFIFSIMMIKWVVPSGLMLTVNMIWIRLTD